MLMSVPPISDMGQGIDIKDQYRYDRHYVSTASTSGIGIIIIDLGYLMRYHLIVYLITHDLMMSYLMRIHYLRCCRVRCRDSADNATFSPGWRRDRS